MKTSIKVFLKAPITTPQGGGFKSLNLTTRKMLGRVAGSGVAFIKLETRCNFDGEAGYSLGQGQ